MLYMKCIADSGTLDIGIWEYCTVVWENSTLKNFRRWCDMMKIERMKYF